MDELAAAPFRRRRPRRLCEGKSRQTGQPCGNAPTPGSRRCRFHGGRLNQGNRKQRDIAAQAKVEQHIRRMLPPETEWQHLDPLEAADMYRAEADAWLSVCRREVDKLQSFEVTSVLNFGNGKTLEKVGAEVRAIVAIYTPSVGPSVLRWQPNGPPAGPGRACRDQLERYPNCSRE